MEPQVYNLIKKIHDIIKHKESAGAMTITDMAYVSGLLESILEVYQLEGQQEMPPIIAKGELPETAPKGKKWYDRLLP